MNLFSKFEKVCLYFVSNKKLSIEELRIYKTSINTQIVILSTTIFYSIYCYLLNMPLMATGCFMSSILIASSLYIIKYYNLMKLGNHLSVFGAFLTINIAYFAGGLGSSPPIVWYFIFPLISFLLLDKKSSIIWTILILTSLISMEFSRKIFNFSYNEFTPELQFYTNLINVIIGTTILSIFIFYAMWEKDKAKEQSLKQQQQIFEQNKLIDIGLMAGKIAHEINNPLAVLSLNNILLSKNINENNKNLKLINNNIESIKRISNVISSLKNMTINTSNEKRKKVNPYTVIKSIQDSIDTLLKNIDIKFIIENNSVKKEILIKENVIKQILNNLISNSIDSIEETKSLNKWIKIIIEDIDKDIIQFKIIDSGNPINPELKEKIFQDFFTTKTVGKGVGIGLSVAKKLIQEENGNIKYLDNEKNTSFVIQFPV